MAFHGKSHVCFDTLQPGFPGVAARHAIVLAIAYGSRTTGSEYALPSTL